MQIGLTFLIVDFHAESRFLLVRTLLRKFPNADIVEEEELEHVLDAVRSDRLAAVVVHRTFDESGVQLVRAIRALDPDLPLIMVSGADRSVAALAAGANAFLLYGEWLRVGTVVADQMRAITPVAVTTPSDLPTPPPQAPSCHEAAPSAHHG